MMTVDVLVSVATERFEIRLLRRLPREADHPRNGRERMMPQAQGNDLFFTRTISCLACLVRVSPPALFLDSFVNWSLACFP
jgi:hypothetical protein